MPTRIRAIEQPIWIDEHLPLLAAEGYQVTSEPNGDYNCIAYAAGETDRWWSHLAKVDYYWPEHATRTPSIQSLIEAFAGLGYEPCEDASDEPGFSKIALYANPQGDWTHAAVQLPGGGWSSKLGLYEDISHRTPESLDPGFYGGVHCFMRRPL